MTEILATSSARGELKCRMQSKAIIQYVSIHEIIWSNVIQTLLMRNETHKNAAVAHQTLACDAANGN